jgi:hypothetical protein
MLRDRGDATLYASCVIMYSEGRFWDVECRALVDVGSGCRFLLGLGLGGRDSGGCLAKLDAVF